MEKTNAASPAAMIRCLTAFAVASVGYVSMPAISARADVKIVSSVSVSGQLTWDKSVSSGANATGSESSLTADRSAVYTTFFKGDKARREVSNGSTVVLYDKSADKVYTIDALAKTYFVVPFKEAISNGSALPPGIADTMNLLTSIDLDEAAGAADGNRVIAGRSSEKFILFGSVAAGPKSADTPGFVPSSSAFSHGNGADYPGGASDLPDGETPMPRLGRSTLNGSLWVTDAPSLIGKGTKEEKDLSIALLQQELPLCCPLLKPLANELHKKRSLPTASKITLRVYGWSSGDNSASGLSSAASSTDHSDELTITMEVESVADGLVLEESLFDLPQGLTRVNPPAARSPLPRQR